MAKMHMKGVYWLARLFDAAFTATAAMAHTSDVFEEGLAAREGSIVNGTRFIAGTRPVIEPWSCMCP